MPVMCPGDGLLMKAHGESVRYSWESVKLLINLITKLLQPEFKKNPKQTLRTQNIK